MTSLNIEGCIDKVHMSNAFLLVLLASFRAKRLAAGEEQSTIPELDNKAPVTALWEIYKGTISMDSLEATVIQNVLQPFRSDDVIVVEDLNDNSTAGKLEESASSNFEGQADVDSLKLLSEEDLLRAMESDASKSSHKASIKNFADDFL